ATGFPAGRRHPECSPRCTGRADSRCASDERNDEMTTTLTIEELEQSGERELGTSDWHEIAQEQINLFAEATGDHQWIHVDPEAAANGPVVTTVAHRYLTRAMLPKLLGEDVPVSDAVLGDHYETEKIRCT